MLWNQIRCRFSMQSVWLLLFVKGVKCINIFILNTLIYDGWIQIHSEHAPTQESIRIKWHGKSNLSLTCSMHLHLKHHVKCYQKCGILSCKNKHRTSRNQKRKQTMKNISLKIVKLCIQIVIKKINKDSTLMHEVQMQLEIRYCLWFLNTCDKMMHPHKPVYIHFLATQSIHIPVIASHTPYLKLPTNFQNLKSGFTPSEGCRCDPRKFLPVHVLSGIQSSFFGEKNNNIFSTWRHINPLRQASRTVDTHTQSSLSVSEQCN